jgi:hypothetical protein
MSRLRIAAGHNKAFGDCVVFPGFISGTVRRIDSDYQPVLQPRLYKRQREIVVVYKPAANNDTLSKETTFFFLALRGTRPHGAHPGKRECAIGQFSIRTPRIERSTEHALFRR